jgi:hypothetical protein
MARYPSPADVNWSLGLQEAPKYINTVTDGVVMNLILLAIAMIIGSSFWFVRRDLAGAVAVGSFVAWVVGLLFWLGDILTGFNFIFLSAVMIGSVVYVIVSANQNP